MAGKKQSDSFAGLEALRAVSDTEETQQEPTKTAGKEIAEKALEKDKAKKAKHMGIRIGGADLEKVEHLAMKLKQHGLQYSEANAVRLALRTCKPSEKDITKIAQQIKDEDGRKRR